MTITKMIHFIAILLISWTCTSCKEQHKTIQKTIHLQQTHDAYLNKNTSDDIHLSYSHQQLFFKKPKSKAFSTMAFKKTSIKKTKTENEFKRINSSKKYGENKQEINSEWFDKHYQNMNLNTFPNINKPAITIENSNLRLIPTSKPIFNGINNNVDGFPFDVNQNSAIPANTPIYIAHISKDKAWVLVETSFAYGWIKIRDIAYAGPKFQKKFLNHSQFVAITEDDLAIKTFAGNYLFNGYIGMMFPLLKETSINYHIITACANTSKYAYIKESVISKKTAKKMPIPLTIKNISTICNKVTNKPYGWGGLYNNRDCSAMIKDIFTPFGIWLPRNSTSQAKKGGFYIDISTMQPHMKEQFILENAIPYLTLLWFPGHIMLYIGEQDNYPIVFHNIWGVRTTDHLKEK